MNPFFERIYKLQKKQGPLSSNKIIHELGKEISKLKNKNESILYWAYKNNIDIYCPCLTDGSIGDLIYFFKNKKKDFYIDIVGDTKKIIDYTLNQEKTAAIILGGGISKHYVLNANIFKDGLDYAVYISTSQFFDGSDSGGNQEEAISWNKIKPDALKAKVYAEATLVFPLLVAATFANK
jgi:deoxyhypusine synthase